MLSLSDTQLAKRLVQHKAVIIKSDADAYPAYPNGDRRKRPVCWVGRDSFKVLTSFGGLEPKNDGYVIVKSFTKRCEAGGSFAAQHRDVEERDIYIQSGVKRPVRINASLSALDRLYRRRDRQGQPLLSGAEYEAGQHYARDYALAGYNSIGTQNYMSAGSDKTHYSGGNIEALDRSIDARRRLERADAIVGVGLKKALIAVCCMDISLDEVERAENWATSSGLTILKMGLAALAAHYGTNAGRR